MIEQYPKKEILDLIKEIETQPDITQRQISDTLGISLGKTNYLLKELIKKGLVEVNNFTGNSGKLEKIHYMLTRRGFEHKILLLQHFLKEKEGEYIKLKEEWEKVKDKI
jgi:EPS-associated MarR family transcriptional regulator